MKKYIVPFLFALSLTVNAQDSIPKQKAAFIDFHAGPGFRLGKPSGSEGSIENDYARRLMSGFQFDISMYFRAISGKNHFVGFKYNNFMKEAGMSGVTVTAPDGGTATKFSDKISLSFYGVAYLFNMPQGNGEFNVEGAIGYMTYRNRADYVDEFDITGNTIGVFLGGSYYFNISPAVAFGPKIDVILGKLNKLEISGPGYTETVKPDGGESMSRIDLSLGIRLKI